MSDRYARQISLPELGADGQFRLMQARVAIVGVGGLGCPAALYLAAAGVGHLGLIDDDEVARSNLQRQILFETRDQGQLKVETARARLSRFNPEIEITSHPVRLGPENAEELLSQYDVILDGTDNFNTKFLLSDVTTRLGKPLVFGTVTGFEGQVTIFQPPGPCYRCLHPQPPRTAIPNCAESGVLGAMAGIVGSVQALQTLKLLIASERLKPLIGRIWALDGTTLETRLLDLPKRPDCPGCETSLQSERRDIPAEISPDELLSAPAGRFLVIDVREPHEWVTAHIPGARNIPLSAFSEPDEAPLSELPRDREIVLYCHAGVRSEWALEILRGAGFLKSCHLRGGIARWRGAVSQGAHPGGLDGTPNREP